MNTAAYTAGDSLYLGATAGSLTTTKPYAPNHLVYIGTVEKANAGNGQIYVRVQNGYEMDELHNVSAQSPSNGQTIVYNSSTSLWEKNTVSLTAGVNGTLPVANGGTGQTTAQAAMNAFAGAVTSGSYLRGNGTNVVMATIQAADVPTLNQNTTGTAAGLSSTLAVDSGGTGQTSFTDGQLLIGNSTGNTLAKATLTAGTNISITNGAGSITIANTAPAGVTTGKAIAMAIVFGG